MDAVLFDVDCHELDAAGSGWALRPRAAPLAPGIARLHAAHAGPRVYTTCCSGRMPRPGQIAGLVHVPFAADDRAWLAGAAGQRRFYIEKRAFGDPRINAERRAWDACGGNPQAGILVGLLAPRPWLVYGNAFESCVAAAVRSLIAYGARVLLIDDLCVGGIGDGPGVHAQVRGQLIAAGATATDLAAAVEGRAA